MKHADDIKLCTKASGATVHITRGPGLKSQNSRSWNLTVNDQTVTAADLIEIGKWLQQQGRLIAGA